jgi:imidazolonepropionase-like amidohydrolase
MTPLQAIQAATRNAAQALGRERDVGAIAVGRFGDLVAVTGDPTRNAAQALGREDDVGAIAVGRFGDFVAVRGDPTADVRLLETVDAVVKGGMLVEKAR